MEALHIENIEHTYQAKNGEVTALTDINFSMQQGDFYSLVGPSGCGKSTLLSIVAGLLTPSGGRVLIGGKPVTDISPRIGYMLQKDNLLEWRTIRKNVLFGLEIRKKLNPQTIEHADRLLKTYGLYEFKDKYPSQISGGMRQRVALIRTLAVCPDILLLDEAFSALDYQTRLEVTEDVYRILKQENITTLMVTHDIPECISMSDVVVILTPRPATVKELLPIRFDLPHRSPLACRNTTQFSKYFDHIWKELEHHA